MNLKQKSRAMLGLVVSGLNHYMHKIQEDPNTRDVKAIAKQYGYDWKEVKEFLDEHPFVRTP